MATAPPGRTRASSLVLDRQSDAERDLLTQQQQGDDALEGAAAATAAADMAAAAIVSSCEVAQQVLQHLQELGPSAAAALMVRIQ